MGQQMSHAIIGEKSMVILDIAADVAALPNTRLARAAGKSGLLESEFQSRRDFLSSLIAMHGSMRMSELEGHTQLLFPMSLATLYSLDNDLDGRFHKRDVERMLRRWYKSLALAKRTYRNLPSWKQAALRKAVTQLKTSSPGSDVGSGLLTLFTVRRIMASINSHSIWKVGKGLCEDLSSYTFETDSPDLRNLAVCVLAADSILGEDCAKMAFSIEDSSKRFCTWLWKLLTAKPNGKFSDIVGVKQLSALTLLMYEDTLDIDQLAFSPRRNCIDAGSCTAADALKLNEETFEKTSRELIALYNNKGAAVLEREDFSVVADLVAKIFKFRGSDLKAVGRYELKSGIGSGANGIVRLGRDIYSGKRVAVKSYNRMDQGQEMSLEAVMSKNMEIESTLKIYEEILPHPQITKLQDVIVTDLRIHLIYQFCGGGSLFDLLSHRRVEAVADSPTTMSPMSSPRCSADEKSNGGHYRTGSLSRHGSSDSLDRMQGLPRRGSCDHLTKLKDNLRVLSVKNKVTTLSSVGASQASFEMDQVNSGSGSLASEDESRMIVRAVASALDHLHRKGICHRDVRLRNLLYNAAKQQVELADFDTARKTSPGWDLFDGENVVGSLYYLSPEQVARQAYSGFAADMWGVGICMYWLLNGKPPYVGDSPESVFAAVRKQDLVPIEGISPEAWSLVTRLLSTNPNSRPSPEQVLADPWLAQDDTVSLQPLMSLYLFESKVDISGPRHMSLVSKLIESILSDADAHHISVTGGTECIFFCTLPEHDIKFSINVRVENSHGILEFKLVRGQGLIFVKASRKISKLWSQRLNGLILKTPRRDSAELERTLDNDMVVAAARKNRTCKLRLPITLPPLPIRH
mmetsp:Transcript_4864/g.14670  ORF Transcript_4864/g.14670 Transcript_4864/m.14670 type:complete len:860 (+) Transcript_4864:155-2734(+)|eukprot:CAMPEP_0198731276 /NCGR_PEP_ID=MMETSP1475-20131203/29117_1 /TAXON_ID= ORGANISM="Unidentified sp., Strain CCMP1999" /NCGR_SAMPLE_ID=MMETSP1475 /ASSEMBLY_ACC=CAM_ASM_001111 /LENGTH=859 /DNA_ID=CAMNT_0044494225 /DNA_START=105 /DNA_END=2684 /DNA_ORIENTATION=-